MTLFRTQLWSIGTAYMIMTRLDYTLLIAGVGETGAPRGKPTKTAIEVTSLLARRHRQISTFPQLHSWKNLAKLIFQTCTQWGLLVGQVDISQSLELQSISSFFLSHFLRESFSCIHFQFDQESDQTLSFGHFLLAWPGTEQKTCHNLTVSYENLNICCTT